MTVEVPFLPRPDAERVRKEIASTAETALVKLRAELAAFGTGKKPKRLPESWVRNFAKVSDQLRRDYRIEPLAQQAGTGDLGLGASNSPATSPEPRDPLSGLRLLNDEDAA